MKRFSTDSCSAQALDGTGPLKDQPAPVEVTVSLFLQLTSYNSSFSRRRVVSFQSKRTLSRFLCGGSVSDWWSSALQLHRLPPSALSNRQ